MKAFYVFTNGVKLDLSLPLITSTCMIFSFVELFLTYLSPVCFVEFKKCTGFPGPGAEHHILMNPMAEYVSGYNAHIHEMFEHFKVRHGKKYSDYVEEARRKNIFMNNVR